jgi:hypothetical protein
MVKEIEIRDVPKELLFIGMRVAWHEMYTPKYIGKIISINDVYIQVKWDSYTEIYSYFFDTHHLFIAFERCKKLQWLIDRLANR